MNSKLVVLAIVLATTALANVGCSHSTEQEEATESAAEAISGCAAITWKATDPANQAGIGGRTYWQVTNYCQHAVNVRIDVVSHQDPQCQVIGGGRAATFSLGIGFGDPTGGFGDRGVVDC